MQYYSLASSTYSLSITAEQLVGVLQLKHDMYTARAKTGQMYQQMYDQAMADAARRLGEICLPYGVEASAQHVRYGRVAHEVHALLSEGQFDVCMVGSHGRSGWQRILGSKAASILHGVSVDTWVFKLRDLQPTAEPESSLG